MTMIMMSVDAYQDLVVMMGAKENGYKRKPHDACGVHCEANIPGREVYYYIITSLHHYVGKRKRV